MSRVAAGHLGVSSLHMRNDAVTTVGYGLGRVSETTWLGRKRRNRRRGQQGNKSLYTMKREPLDQRHWWLLRLREQ
jgi:hypothetical protein